MFKIEAFIPSGPLFSRLDRPEWQTIDDVTDDAIFKKTKSYSLDQIDQVRWFENQKSLKTVVTEMTLSSAIVPEYFLDVIMMS